MSIRNKKSQANVGSIIEWVGKFIIPILFFIFVVAFIVVIVKLLMKYA